MSWFYPTTTVTIQRGTSVNEYGDPVDDATVIETGVLCAVSEGFTGVVGRPQRGFAPAQDQGTVIETYTVRFRPNVLVEEQDRLVDEMTGAVYLVISVMNPRNAVAAADVRVEATRVASRSQPVNG